MLLARAPDGSRIEPAPAARARCPQCGAEVLAKCGSLVSWHWAHRSAECDAWSDGETEWHLRWKRRALPSACEVVIGDHRADVQTATGRVIELQHSPIGPDVIAQREAFYGDLVWIFDARKFQLALYPRAARVDFEWRHPRRSLRGVTKPMYWDLGGGFALAVESLSPDSPLGGFTGAGVLVDTACLASAVFGPSARPEVHLEAAQRSSRVARCIGLARDSLRGEPRLGIDEALRRAMQQLAL